MDSILSLIIWIGVVYFVIAKVAVKAYKETCRRKWNSEFYWNQEGK